VLALIRRLRVLSPQGLCDQLVNVVKLTAFQALLNKRFGFWTRNLDRHDELSYSIVAISQP